jgi:hypothetical protein
MVPESDWKWFGFAAHFICGRWCRFHLATQVGEFLVSTVGQLVHPKDSKGRENVDAAYLAEYPNGAEIGYQRFYETMVFKAGPPCDAPGCNCGLPLPTDHGELDMEGYNDPGAATIGHRMMCLKVASGNVQVSE